MSSLFVTCVNVQIKKKNEKSIRRELLTIFVIYTTVYFYFLLYMYICFFNLFNKANFYYDANEDIEHVNSASNLPTQQFYTARYLSPVIMPNNENIYGIQGNTEQNINVQSPMQAQSCSKPPPYHIAKNFTKKTAEDLTNYENLRYQQLKSNCNIEDNIVGLNSHEPLHFSNTPETSNYNGNNNNNNDESVDNEGNSCNENQFPHKNTSVLNNSNISHSISQLSVSSMDHSKNSSYVQNKNVGISNNALNSSQKSSWLFGLHKNPTVVSILLLKFNKS